jgi:hypothetical protein
MRSKRWILPACLALGLAALARPASAQQIFHVNLDTSFLNPASTYYTEFTLSDGHVVSSGTPDTNNNVVISNFTFGGGASGAVLPPEVGNASGSTASSVLLADGDPGGVADHAQAFLPGASLEFDVFTTTNLDIGVNPDVLTFYLLDPSINPFSTNAPTDTPNAFFRLDLTGPGVTINSVGTYGNTSVPIRPPRISAITTTPEPGSVAFGIGVSLCGALTARRRRRHTQTR